MNSLRHSLLMLAAALLLSVSVTACANPEADMEDGIYVGNPYDPLESLNRAIFGFNRFVDRIVLEPTARLYRGVVPHAGREGVHNFLTNLKAPIVILNSVLQGDIHNAFASFWSFILNTTVGFGGVYDFAGHYAVSARDEGFGQTLGVWGVAPGPYLVLPIIGPSSLRDGVGLVADVFSHPLTHELSEGWKYGWAGAMILDTRERNLDLIDQIFRDSVDPYATIRSGFWQNRQAQIENRKPTAQAPLP